MYPQLCNMTHYRIKVDVVCIYTTMKTSEQTLKLRIPTEPQKQPCFICRLKVRMQDLDKPLRFVNRPLWEEMRSLSEEEVLIASQLI